MLVKPKRLQPGCPDSLFVIYRESKLKVNHDITQK